MRIDVTNPGRLGRQIGHFRIVDFVASGGMGAVYVGFDERLQRKVALKALHAGQLDAEAKARFLREARVLSQLKHPHICQIHDLLEAPEGDFLVLELIDGRNLGAVLAAKPDPALRMRVARQLAEVLAATHAKGIIHRDLKPANVMVTPRGTSRCSTSAWPAAWRSGPTISPSHGSTMCRRFRGTSPVTR